MTDTRDIFLGNDEPEEMWLTGKAAILFLTYMELPLVDRDGKPIDEDHAYHFSKAGLCRV